MKKILIISEKTSIASLDKATRNLGYEPIFIYNDVKASIDNHYPFHIIDFFRQPEIVAKEILECIGKISGIVSCIEQLTYQVGEVARILGVEINPLNSYLILRDKRKMKKCWIDSGVSTAKFYGTYTKFEDIKSEKLSFPLIVKPTFGAASAGVQKIDSMESLDVQMKNIARFNATVLFKENATKSGCMIEQYISGDEYSVDTVWINGKPIVDGIMSKGNPSGPLFLDRLYCTEVKMDSQIRELILQESYKAIRAAGVKNGATHSEMRVMDGNVYIIEAALRPGAGGAFYQIFEKTTGIKYYEYLIMAYIPECIKKFQYLHFNYLPSRNLFWYNVTYKGHGIIKNLKIKTFQENIEGIEKIYYLREVGDYLPEEGKTFSYLVWIFGEFPSNAISNEITRQLYLESLDDIVQIEFE
ncbi:MAG TPA: ATP-grasp domain-containing protein [Lactovum miscens]|uniref:ATP-grasp domain-containing protein n=1 Tax=Lactovum miscens TaxID=190387 RepID=UPI002ED92194